MSVWDQLQQLQERQQWEEEHCPHDIPHDSGKFCLECAIDRKAEPDPIPAEWHLEYNQYLQEQEQEQSSGEKNR